MISSLLLAALVQAPPVVTTVSTEPMPVLQSWRVDLTCEGRPVSAAVAVQPLAELRFASPSAADPPIQIGFSIDATGRPLDIAAVGHAYALAYNDVAPALAATRFTPAERRGCVATFTPERASIAQAAPAAVIGYTIFPTGGSRPPRALFDRVRPAGSTCFDPAPAVLNRAYPDFSTVPQAPGTMSWSMVGFDIDANGRPMHVRRLEGTGNAVLDTKAVAAVQQSRFANGARTGCLYPYYRRGEPLPAPPITIAKDWRPEGSTCPPDPVIWAKAPVYSFPENFRRRGIEGWAVVQYDVAPWGEIGDTRVLAAQPAAAFGESAVAVLRGARRPASSGYRGCVDRVRFVVRDSAVQRAPNEVVPPPD